MYKLVSGEIHFSFFLQLVNDCASVGLPVFEEDSRVFFFIPKSMVSGPKKNLKKLWGHTV